MKKLAAAAGVAGVLALAACSSGPIAAPTVTVTVPGTTVTVPVPGPTVTVEARSPVSGGNLTDAQRNTLDAMSGRGTEASLMDAYCPMDDGGRAYYADLIARQIDGMSPENVLQYFNEVC